MYQFKTIEDKEYLEENYVQAVVNVPTLTIKNGNVDEVLKQAQNWVDMIIDSMPQRYLAYKWISNPTLKTLPVLRPDIKTMVNVQFITDRYGYQKLQFYRPITEPERKARVARKLAAEKRKQASAERRKKHKAAQQATEIKKLKELAAKYPEVIEKIVFD